MPAKELTPLRLAQNAVRRGLLACGNVPELSFVGPAAYQLMEKAFVLCASPLSPVAIYRQNRSDRLVYGDSDLDYYVVYGDVSPADEYRILSSFFRRYLPVRTLMPPLYAEPYAVSEMKSPLVSTYGRDQVRKPPANWQLISGENILIGNVLDTPQYPLRRQAGFWFHRRLIRDILADPKSDYVRPFVKVARVICLALDASDSALEEHLVEAEKSGFRVEDGRKYRLTGFKLVRQMLDRQYKKRLSAAKLRKAVASKKSGFEMSPELNQALESVSDVGVKSAVAYPKPYLEAGESADVLAPKDAAEDELESILEVMKASGAQMRLYTENQWVGERTFLADNDPFISLHICRHGCAALGKDPRSLLLKQKDEWVRRKALETWVSYSSVELKLFPRSHLTSDYIQNVSFRLLAVESYANKSTPASCPKEIVESAGKAHLNFPQHIADLLIERPYEAKEEVFVRFRERRERIAGLLSH
ncbi:Uncharacterised protein [uncultured archaeon]|nr:Uncharacterised protein [uncultured archaeon]